MIFDNSAMNRDNRFVYVLLPGLLVFTAALLIRLYLTYSIGDSGDEFIKWYETKRVLYGLGWDRFDHHTVRWSLNSPVLLAQWLFGTKPAVYYFAPVFFGALASLFVFNIARSISGIWTGIAAVLLFTIAPSVSRAGSQFLPAIFTCAYVLGSAYFILCYTRRRSQHSAYLVVAALFMFLAYGTKVPNLFFLPGICLFLYWRSRSLKPILIFLLILLAFYIAETIGLALFTGEFKWTGRLYYLGFHMNRMLEEEHIYHFSDIWKRWTILPAYWQVLLASACASGIFAWTRKLDDCSSGIILIFFMLLSFSILTTFAITDADPLRFVQPLRPRYLTITLPLAVIVSICAIAMINIVMAPVTVLVFCMVWVPNYSAQLRPDWVPAVLRVNDYQKSISDHWRNNYALCFKRAKHSRLYRSVYLEDDILFKKDGSIEKITRINPKRFSFPTGQPIIFMISRTNMPIGYLELARSQSFVSKKDFDEPKRAIR